MAGSAVIKRSNRPEERSSLHQEDSRNFPETSFPIGKNIICLSLNCIICLSLNCRSWPQLWIDWLAEIGQKGSRGFVTFPDMHRRTFLTALVLASARSLLAASGSGSARRGICAF